MALTIPVNVGLRPYYDFLLAVGCSRYIKFSNEALPGTNSLVHACMFGRRVQSQSRTGHSEGSAESTFGESASHPRLEKKAISWTS